MVSGLRIAGGRIINGMELPAALHRYVWTGMCSLSKLIPRKALPVTWCYFFSLFFLLLT